MFLPILYTIMTTICAFLSLIFGNIKPIIDFGWMMTLGLIVSLYVTFAILPSLLNIFSSENEIGVKDTEKSIILHFFLHQWQNRSNFLVFGSTFIILYLA